VKKVLTGIRCLSGVSGLVRLLPLSRNIAFSLLRRRPVGSQKSIPRYSRRFWRSHGSSLIAGTGSYPPSCSNQQPRPEGRGMLFSSGG
jgi:hypothetical protein